MKKALTVSAIWLGFVGVMLFAFVVFIKAAPALALICEI